MLIPMSSPDITAAERAAVAAVLEGGALSRGPQTDRFEAAIAAAVRSPHAVAVNSGTAALHLALIAAGVREHDLVVTTPFSFIASSNAVLYQRGVPIFVDVDPRTGNIDPALAAEAVAAVRAGDGRARRWLPPSLRHAGSRAASRLTALLPVHCFGQPAEMAPLVRTATENGLRLIEDACEALGSEYQGRPVGTFGDAAAFAFYANKQVTTGEGGMLVTPHRRWDRLFRSLRNQGRDTDRDGTYLHLGYNYRLSEMSAALGAVQVSRLDELLARRERVAAWYRLRMTPHQPLIEPPATGGALTRVSWFAYVVRLAVGINRRRVMRQLEARGVPTRPYFPPIHLQPVYRDRFGYQAGDFPVAEDLGRRALALPFSSVMTEEQVDYVTTHLVSVVKQQRAIVAA